MDNLVKIENHTSLVRDMNSGAVINTNRTDYNNYLLRRKQQHSMKQQLEQNTSDIRHLKADLSDIKQLLITLINREQ